MNGIEKIKEYFGEFPNNYIVIGGTAYNIIVSDMSFNERSTKDVDMILVESEMNRTFLEAFWRFIKDGGYSVGSKMVEEGTKKNLFYRFVEPVNNDFPEQIELCSRKADGVALPPEVRVMHVKSDNSLSDFSVIILDDDYYEFAVSHTKESKGIIIVDEYALVVLKIKAYLNNKKKKEEGEKIDNKDITKHKNDVYRTSFTFNEATSVIVSEKIKEDIRYFLVAIETDPIDTKNLCKTMGVSELSINRFRELMVTTFEL